MKTERTFVGFGFGPIQIGLFLLEAYRSGNFGRLVVAQRHADVAERVRAAGGKVTLNIAHADHIETATLGPVDVLDTNGESDRRTIVAAIAEAQEMATAVSSIDDYRNDQPDSIHQLLAAGLDLKVKQGGPPCLIYNAENDNHAAAHLKAAVFEVLEPATIHALVNKVTFVDTVIGKMSGTAKGSLNGLAPLTPGSDRAVLVEAFNRILISKVRLSGFERGISVFEEKPDLFPFEEAKLYGHNAVHALAAYLGGVAGLETITQWRDLPGGLSFLRAAFLEESGGALIAKYAGFDSLFSPKGFEVYADDLLERMTNPFLNDSVERVGRDPKRKLGWNDRLVGAMRLALSQNVEPKRLALGVAAALSNIVMDEPGLFLQDLWAKNNPDIEQQRAVLERIHQALRHLAAWQRSPTFSFEHLAEEYD